MSGECQVNVKSQSELDIGGRETYQLSSSGSNVKHQLSKLDPEIGSVMG